MNLLFKIIPSLAWVLSDASPAKSFRLASCLTVFAIRNKFMPKGQGWKFKFSYHGTPFELMLESNVDIAALREIFLLREYEWEPFSEPKTIIDLGAHFGDTALYYHLRYPDATIIAVEPSPESFQRLRYNTHDVKNIIPVQAAIGDRDGETVLYIASSSLGSSLKPRTAASHAVPVPMLTLGSLLARFSISKADIVKFDIEGAEQLLFAEKSPAEFARAFIGEVHGDLMDIPVAEFTGRFDRAFELDLRQLGADRFMLRAKMK